MVQVGVAHRRVLAHDVHAAHLVRVAVRRQRLVHDFDHRVAGRVIELGAPEAFKPRMRPGVVHALVVGEHHGDQPRVARALHVVLAAQRVQARAGLADLAGDGAQRDQAARVVGAVDVLAHAHAPEDHRGLGLRKRTRHLAQCLGRDAAHRRHGLGAAAHHVGLERLEIVGAIADKCLIHQAFVDHRVDQCVEQGHVGVGLELQRAPGVAADVGHARVGQHDLGATFCGVLHPGGGHGVVGCGVGADHEDQLGMLHVVHRVAHRARAHAFEQRGHAGGVAQPRAVVHVVAAKAGAHQLLEQVGLFVAALGRAKACQRLAAVRVAQALELACGQVQRFVPGRFAEGIAPVGAMGPHLFGHAGLADQRHRQAVGVVGVVETKAPLHAQAAMVGRAVAAFDADDFFVAHVVGDEAAHAAERADRIDLAVHLLGADVRLGAERARGAGLHAFAAGHAGAFGHGVVEVEDDLALGPAQRVADHVVDLLFTAGAHAAVALDAGVQVHRHGGVAQIGRGLLAAQGFQRGPHCHAQAGGPFAQLAVLTCRFWSFRVKLASSAFWISATSY